MAVPLRTAPRPLNPVYSSAGMLAVQAFVLAYAAWLGWMFWQDGAYAASALVFAAIYLLVLWWSAARFGIFDSRFLVLLGSGLYAFTSVLDIYLFENEGGFSEEITTRLLLLADFFFVSFYIVSAYWHLPMRRRARARVGPAVDLRILVPLLTLALAAYVALFEFTIGLFHHYSRAELYQLTPPAISAARYAILIGLLVLVAQVRPMWLRADEKPRALLHACVEELGKWRTSCLLAIPSIYFGMDIVEFGDRRFLLTFAISALAIVAPKRVPRLVIGIAVAAIAALLVFGVLRDRPVAEWPALLTNGAVVQTFRPSNLEFAYWPRIAEDVLNRPADDLADVPPPPKAQDALLSVLPRFMYPDRPEGFGEWYARTFYPKYWLEGGGYAGNIILESFLDWGPFGPPLLGALLGCLFPLIIACWREGRLGHGLLVFTFVFAMRFDFVTLLKTFGLVAGIGTAWVLICSQRALPWIERRAESTH